MIWPFSEIDLAGFSAIEWIGHENKHCDRERTFRGSPPQVREFKEARITTLRAKIVTKIIEKWKDEMVFKELSRETRAVDLAVSNNKMFPFRWFG